MSNLICTIVCDCENQNTELHDLLLPIQRKYAQSIKADYMVIHNDEVKYVEHKKNRHISMSTFNVYGLINKFDRVLCIDPDMLIKPSTPDVFKVFPDKSAHYCIKESEKNSGGAACIMLFANDKKYYDISLLNGVSRKTDEKTQDILFGITKPPFQDMGYKWNCFYMPTGNYSCPKDEAYVIHYVGHIRLLDKEEPSQLEINNFKFKQAQKDIEQYF